MLYSIKKEPNNLYKVRIFVKATMLSFCNVNPIAVVILTVVIDVVLMIGVYLLIDVRKCKWIYFSFFNNLLLNAVLIIMLVMPS